MNVHVFVKTYRGSKDKRSNFAFRGEMAEREMVQFRAKFSPRKSPISREIFSVFLRETNIGKISGHLSRGCNKIFRAFRGEKKVSFYVLSFLIR